MCHVPIDIPERKNTRILRQCSFQMSTEILAIVEFGAQKQRIPLNSQSSYHEICQQIYALFQLDPTKSKYLLQQQDLYKPGSFVSVNEQEFLKNLKQYAANRKGNTPIRLRLMPLNMKIQVNLDPWFVLFPHSKTISAQN